MWWYFSLYRILVQVVCCKVQIIHATTFKPFLSFGKRSSCIVLSGSSFMRTAWEVRRQISRFLSKTRRISKASIFLFSLQHVLSLLHRYCFLGMSHLNWDPYTCLRLRCHESRGRSEPPLTTQGDRAGIQNHRLLMLEKKSCKLVTNNAAFLQPRLLSTFSRLQRKVLKGTSKCTRPANLHQVCLKSSFPGSMLTRVLTTARQWVH